MHHEAINDQLNKAWKYLNISNLPYLIVVCSFEILQPLLIFENRFLSRLQFCQELDVIESRAVGEFVVDDVHFIRRRVEIQICDALTKLILSDVTMIVPEINVLRVNVDIQALQQRTKFFKLDNLENNTWKKHDFLK